uniref:Uncharacterized protein n=1 Tax=Candidatus Methanophaga sp. ANME-1 ERB7 TaxID=2759913 RepID=A0A7G9Z3G7_9EURY|nr:hypothetical protein FJCIDEAL_00009 [Methanosarcinales archaeon ANME-1 ERB7]QNO55155.1 hypothetical protein FBIBDDDO_00017 [Methanosarcinales archaeon ANME-1 ERB7]
MIDRYENNYGQNTVYKSCVKGTWWKPWEPADLNVECIKIKAEGYSDYKPNFCYERKWDSASITEVGLIAGEVALGVDVGILASPSGPGAIDSCVLRDNHRCVSCRGMAACRDNGRGQVAERDNRPVRDVMLLFFG